MSKANYTVLGIKENVEGAIAYVLGFITGILFLLIEKNEFVRFHAKQSTVFSFLWLVLSMIVGVIPMVGWILNSIITFVGFLLWLYLMYKSYKGEKYLLPFLENLLE